MKLFGDFDILGLWEESDYSAKEYEGRFVTPEMIDAVQSALGYKLPASYLELLRIKNGLYFKQVIFKNLSIPVSGIYGIDPLKPRSLLGAYGNQFWVEEWGYPSLGIYFGDGISAGHEKLCLNYTNCSSEGEPQVVLVDQESDYKVTVVSKNFEEFIRGLKLDPSTPQNPAPAQIISVKTSPDFKKKFKKYLK